MSEIGLGGQTPRNPFQVGVVALMLALGILSFIGLLVLGAYAPDLRSGRNGGGHALSNSATGYAGIVQLARATGRNPRIVRSEHEFDQDDLLIVTPETGFVDISPVVSHREAKPTLIVLPKWETREDPAHRGWVNWVGLDPLSVPIGVLAPGTNFTMAQYRSHGAPLVNERLPDNVRFRAPQPLQVITGLQKPKDEGKAQARTRASAPGNDMGDVEDEKERAPEDLRPDQRKLTPLITDGHGGIVLAQLGDGPLFVLADPDLISNRGMRDVHQAASALAMLDWLNTNPPKSMAFDVSLNGFGHSKSPLKLLFEPPFLAMTLCVAAALLLAGWQAFGRFGPTRPGERAIAFGKAALVDNSAALVRKAGRERAMGSRYANLVRERAVAIFGIPARLRDGALDAYLDQLKTGRRFTDLAAQAEVADDRDSLLAAAQALHSWQKEKMR